MNFDAGGRVPAVESNHIERHTKWVGTTHQLCCELILSGTVRCQGFVEDVQWPAEAAVIDGRLKMKPYGQPGSMSRASSLSARHLASDSLSSEASGLSSHAQREPAGAVISEGASLVRQQPADPSLWGRTGAGHVASIQRCVHCQPAQCGLYSSLSNNDVYHQGCKGFPHLQYACKMLTIDEYINLRKTI